MVPDEGFDFQRLVRRGHDHVERDAAAIIVLVPRHDFSQVAYDSIVTALSVAKTTVPVVDVLRAVETDEDVNVVFSQKIDDGVGDQGAVCGEVETDSFLSGGFFKVLNSFSDEVEPQQRFATIKAYSDFFSVLTVRKEIINRFSGNAPGHVSGRMRPLVEVSAGVDTVAAAEVAGFRNVENDLFKPRIEISSYRCEGLVVAKGGGTKVFKETCFRKRHNLRYGAPDFFL